MSARDVVVTLRLSAHAPRRERFFVRISSTGVVSHAPISARSNLRMPDECISGKTERVVTHILWPRGDDIVKTHLIVGIERARGIFVSRQIAGERGHEAIHRFLRRTFAVLVLARQPRRFNEFAQCDRSAPRLPVEPVPMTRQQRDLLATTPSLGRPRPRGVSSSPASAIGAGCPTGAWLTSRARISSGVPRKSNSTGRLVTVSKISTGARSPRASTSRTASATSASVPDAIRRCPSKAMQVAGWGS